MLSAKQIARFFKSAIFQELINKLSRFFAWRLNERKKKKVFMKEKS